MGLTDRVSKRGLGICAAVAALAAVVIGAAAVGNFASTTIDIGMVVSDIEKSAAFYKDALGFTEVKGFDVPAEMGGGAGLTDNKPFSVRVFVLGDANEATRLKIMQFADAPGKKPDNTFIHSTLGMRYLTIHVKDIGAALERAKKAGVAPLAKGLYEIPWAKGAAIALVRDPDGNMIEFVGAVK